MASVAKPSTTLPTAATTTGRCGSPVAVQAARTTDIPSPHNVRFCFIRAGARVERGEASAGLSGGHARNDASSFARAKTKKAPQGPFFVRERLLGLRRLMLEWIAHVV